MPELSKKNSLRTKFAMADVVRKWLKGASGGLHSINFVLNAMI